MGGIQSISALPGDPTFSLSDNHYDMASYKRICAEFGIDPSSDFRFTGRKNHGLGDVYIGVTGHGAMKTGPAYPGGFYKFGDEGGKAKDGNLPDISQSVQRYLLAVDEAKVRLNLAVYPEARLMPARMIINTESMVGYNNKLKEAVAGMKLGVNNDVSKQLLEGGLTKINPPNSHPSNPIHKAATAAQKTEASFKANAFR